MKYPFVTEILKRICPKIGATLLIEPEYQFTGQIRFKNGKTQFFRGRSLNINGIWAVEVIKDKTYTKFFLKELWYNVPQWQTFFSSNLNNYLSIKRNIDDGFEYAKNSLTFPVIVKPNASSQWDLVVKVSNKKEYYRAAKKILQKGVLLVEEFCSWYEDYRIVVLDDRVISAYQRIPLEVTWDGILTIHQLLEKKQMEFITIGRNEIIEVEDFRVKTNLKKAGYSLSSILEKWKKFFLLDNANLSSGGTAIDVTDIICEEYKSLAIRATKDMWLRLAWVDILVHDITKVDEDYVILELNGSPWLDNYASLWEEQQERVDNLYLEILKSLEKKDFHNK